MDYYTDPLCVWSWAFETQWRRLRQEFGEQIGWRYRLSGMIADWTHFNDPLNDVGSALQMGPHWYHVRELSGAPLDERIWVDDAPASSYPASLAVKAAGLQGARAAEAYLRRVREAVMLQRRNVARQTVLMELADEVENDAARDFAWDADRFRADLAGPEARALFREDVQDARYREIGRFPTLVLRPARGRAILLTGSRPYEALLRAVAHVAPTLRPTANLASPADFLDRWGRATAYEVAAALEQDASHVRRMLDDGVAAGRLSRTGDGGRELYSTRMNEPAGAFAAAGTTPLPQEQT